MAEDLGVCCRRKENKTQLTTQPADTSDTGAVSKGGASISNYNSMDWVWLGFGLLLDWIGKSGLRPRVTALTGLERMSL